MHRALLGKGFGGRTPDHHQPVRAGLLFEIPDIGPQLLRQIALVLAFLHMFAVQQFHVIAIEHRLARLDGPHERLDLVEQVFLQHTGIHGGGVGIFFKDVPGGEDQVLEVGQRNELADLGRAAVGALPQPYGAHLCKRSNGLGNSLADGLNSGNKRGGHRPHANNHYAQFAAGRCNFGCSCLFSGRSH